MANTTDNVAVGSNQEWDTLLGWLKKGLIDREFYSEVLQAGLRCKHCGHFLIYNDTLRITKCSNPMCIYTAKQRATDMLHALGFLGWGPETCGELIQMHNLKSHFDVLRFAFAKGLKRPVVELWEIAKLAYIPGISGRWQTILFGYSNFREFFADTSNPNSIAYMKYKDILINAEKYFIIQPPYCPDEVWDVMIHGPITGFRNRKDFIKLCNSLIGDLVYLRLHDSACASCQYLITEFKDDDNQKVRVAKANRHRMRIETPEDFVRIVRHAAIKIKQQREQTEASILADPDRLSKGLAGD